MEKSPKIAFNRSRLSLGRKSHHNDSPKTPVRNINSPDCYYTPPASKSIDNTNSTRLDRRKRTCFAEESPSQDYSQSPIQTIFPEEHEHIVDVDWKWDDDTPKKEIPNQKQEKGFRIKRIPPQKKFYERKSPECHQKRGFYKFKEELMKNFLVDTNDKEDARKDMDLDSSLKENDFNSVLKCNENAIQKNKNQLKSSENQTKETNSNLFDDSDLDLDNILLQSSQQLEANYHKLIENKNKTKTDDIEWDSLDEVLMSLPCDEKELKKSVDNKNSSKRDTHPENTPGKTSFGRYNSMPMHSPSTNTNIQRSINNLMRHNSMPPNEEDMKDILGSSNSSEFSDTLKKRCTTEEIKRKRLEAIQRREASKKKQVVFNTKTNIKKINFLNKKDKK